MSDNIQPIRYIPPIRRVNQKGKTGDKKGDDKGGNQDFSNHLSFKDEDVKGNGSNQENEQYKDSVQHKQEDENSLQSRKEDDPDSVCGSILDTEV